MEMAMHLMGLYPKKWKGKIFNRPIWAWTFGTISEATRDAPHRLLLGPTKLSGVGSIPKDLIFRILSTRGITDAVDTIQVRHKCGATSRSHSKILNKVVTNSMAEHLILFGVTRSQRGISIRVPSVNISAYRLHHGNIHAVAN